MTNRFAALAGLLALVAVGCRSERPRANETPAQFALTITRLGGGIGRIVSTPAGIDCGAVCTATFDAGTTVTLTATAAESSSFAGWSRPCLGVGACTVTLSAATEVTATFAPQMFPVSVQRSGPGYVFSIPGGIACGDACVSIFPAGSTVTLQALPATNATFTGWSGGCTGVTACVVEVDGQVDVKANFVPATTRVTVARGGNGTGSVQSVPAGIDCGETCAADFPQGGVVALKATPASGDRFTGWSGECTDTDPVCVVALERAVTVSATFDKVAPPRTHTLTVRNDASGGIVVSVPAGVRCGTQCVGTFPEGVAVELAPVPPSGMTFSGWTGDCSGQGLCSVVMSADRAVGAAFQAGSTGGGGGGGGGGGSGGNPIPTLFAIRANSVPLGTQGARVTISGFGFASGATVFFGGVRHDATVLDPLSIEVPLTEADTAVAKVIPVTVGNPAPGGGLSTTALQLTIANPVPTLTSMSPAGADVGTGSVTLNLYGTNFNASSSVNLTATTTFVSPTELKAVVNLSNYPAQTLQISVRNQAPGGGVSNTLPFALRNPTPQITALSPASIVAGEPAMSLTILGSGFMGSTNSLSSRVHWNGQYRQASWISANELGITVTAAEMAAPGTAQVTITNPTPGGGESAPATFVIEPKPPRISTTVPPWATAGGATRTLELNGTGFTSTSVASWNGLDRPTTFLSAQRLTIPLEAEDLATVGSATLVVRDTSGALASTAPYGFAIVDGAAPTLASTFANYVARDLVADPVRGVVYASIGSAAATYSNQILVLDPVTGTVSATIPVGSNPGQLAMSDDGSKLYVALEGAGKIQRIDLASRAADLLITLVGGDSFYGTLVPGSVQVVPGQARSIAVARKYANGSSSSGGIAIYDDATPRAKATDRYSGDFDTLTFLTPTDMYSYSLSTSPPSLYRVRLDASGVTRVSSIGSAYAFGNDMIGDGGRLYAFSGKILEADGTAAGTLPLGSGWGAPQSSVLPETARGRVFTITNTTLAAYNPGSFSLMGQATLPSPIVPGSRFTRIGSDGIAYRTTSQIVFVRSNIIGR